MKMQETKKMKHLEIFNRKLPPSSYEVIHLPMITNNSPSIKGLHEQQQGEKRRKVTPPVTSQAEGFSSKVEAKYPSFTKTVVKSHVSGCFWMLWPQGLPQPFCRTHLPSTDTELLLENEYGKSYKTRYLAERTALSGGWRGFALAEKLSEGDVLEFQLVTPSKFKVYRIRETGMNDVNPARTTPNVDIHMKQTANNHEAATVEQIRETHKASASGGVSQVEDHKGLLSKEGDEVTEKVENIDKKILESNSRDSKHLEFPPVDDKDHGFTSFEDFINVVDDLLQKDHKLPHYVKWSYYQLCSSQKSLLHVDLLERIGSILVAGCIIETVDIANAIKSCELPTFGHDRVLWDQKLKFLEFLGMNVGFLSAHLRRLEGIACNPEAAKKRQQYMDLCSEHSDTENLIEGLREKLKELIRVSEDRARDMKDLKLDIEKHERRFQEQVSAPW